MMERKAQQEHSALAAAPIPGAASLSMKSGRVRERTVRRFLRRPRGVDYVEAAAQRPKRSPSTE